YPGEPVVVIGPGPIGLFAVQMCRAAGAGTILVLGTTADRRRMEGGRHVGADHAIDVHETDPLPAIMDCTGGRGAPPVVDAAGPAPALKLAMDAVARNGQITKIAWGPQPVNLSLDPIVAKAVSLQGSYSHTWRTWEAVLRMMAAGQLMMEPMVTHRLTIDH